MKIFHWTEACGGWFFSESETRRSLGTASHFFFSHKRRETKRFRLECDNETRIINIFQRVEEIRPIIILAIIIGSETFCVYDENGPSSIII